MQKNKSQPPASTLPPNEQSPEMNPKIYLKTNNALTISAIPPISASPVVAVFVYAVPSPTVNNMLFIPVNRLSNF
jgi:hypothetical protein